MQKTLTTSAVWNVWVLLATPAIWLAYSMIFFCATILTFVWTSGTESMPKAPTAKMSIAPRVIVTIVFVLGVVVFAAIIRSFRSWTDEVVYVRNPNDTFDDLEHAYDVNDKDTHNGGDLA